MLCPQEGVYASIYGCIAYISAPLNQMTKKWVNVIAMSSLHARVVYRPSLQLYLYVSDDPVTAVIICYSNFIYIIYNVSNI